MDEREDEAMGALRADARPAARLEQDLRKRVRCTSAKSAISCTRYQRRTYAIGRLVWLAALVDVRPQEGGNVDHHVRMLPSPLVSIPVGGSVRPPNALTTGGSCPAST